MKLTLGTRDDLLIRIHCEGDVTMDKLIGKPDPLEKILANRDFAGCVLFDMERTNYIDSHGIGWLLRCHKHFVERGGKLIIHSVPPLVKQTLLLLRMNRVFHLADDETAARQLAVASKEAKP